MIDDIKIAEAVAFHLKQVQIGAYDHKDDAAAEALQGILRLFGDDASSLIDDAKRYRWLREQDWIDDHTMSYSGILTGKPETLDMAIDKARSAADGGSR